MGDDSDCEGTNLDYLPPHEIKIYQDNIKKKATSTTCMYYGISSYETPSAQLTGKGLLSDCSYLEKPGITILQPHHKIIFGDGICAKGVNGMLACIDNNIKHGDHQKHGFVLLPHHQSWAF